jgi:hypothetical protein
MSQTQTLARLDSTKSLQVENEPDVFTLGEVLAKSGYFADAKDAAQCVVKVLAGRELGLPAIASMTGIFVIQGKPSLSANLMAAIIKRSGKYNYKVRRMEADGCQIEFFEGGQLIGVSEFTMQDAKVAGALDGKNKHTWQAFPRNMLFARALSNGARWYTPDIFSGPIYTPEELDAPVSSDGIPEASVPVRQLQAAPAPAESEDDPKEKQAIIHELFDTCKKLNDAKIYTKDAHGGARAQWTSVTLKIFVNEEFKVKNGLADLTIADLRQLHETLNQKLTSGVAGVAETQS